jgi:hypothetical protein
VGALTAASPNSGDPENVPDATTIATGTKSVTFTVTPLYTKVAVHPATAAGYDPEDASYVAPPSADTTFWTSYNAATKSAIPTTSGDTVATWIGPEPNVQYPMFKLAEGETTGALYMIKGDNGTTTVDIKALTLGTQTGLNLTNVIILRRPGMVSLSLPAYSYRGQRYYVKDQYKYNVVPTMLNNDNAGDPFEPNIQLTFESKGHSIGILGFCVEFPVVAITEETSTNSLAEGDPGFAAKPWRIMGGFGTYQYYLDDGESAGGLVLLSVGDTGSDDWIDIFYTGGVGQNY